MKVIRLKDAKAALSRILDEVVAGELTIITRRGKPEGVPISYSEFERLSRVPPLGWLLTNSPLEDGDLPRRKPLQY
jgi:prevent-host-death family protein